MRYTCLGVRTMNTAAEKSVKRSLATLWQSSFSTRLLWGSDSSERLRTSSVRCQVQNGNPLDKCGEKTGKNTATKMDVQEGYQ